MGSSHDQQIIIINSSTIYRYWSSITEAVDDFLCSWKDEVNCCLTIQLIPRVIQHARETQAHGTLVAICQPSAPFWPTLFSDGVSPAHFVCRLLELALIEGLALPQQSGAALCTRVPNTQYLETLASSECSIRVVR